jgi:choline-sulfatase
VFYEEACRVPLIISTKNTTSHERVDLQHLVSNGLDILPTLCDYAGIKTPKDINGLSLRPIVERKKLKNWRTVLPVESEIGRMLVSNRYKYIRYNKGENKEQLVDLIIDPGETKNFLRDPKYTNVIRKYRCLFSKYYEINQAIQS